MTHTQHAEAGRYTRAARSAHNRAAHAQAQARAEGTRIREKLAAIESQVLGPAQAPKPARTRRVVETAETHEAQMCTCSCGHRHADMTA